MMIMEAVMFKMMMQGTLVSLLKSSLVRIVDRLVHKNLMDPTMKKKRRRLIVVVFNLSKSRSKE